MVQSPRIRLRPRRRAFEAFVRPDPDAKIDGSRPRLQWKEAVVGSINKRLSVSRKLADNTSHLIVRTDRRPRLYIHEVRRGHWILGKRVDGATLSKEQNEGVILLSFVCNFGESFDLSFAASVASSCLDNLLDLE